MYIHYKDYHIIMQTTKQCCNLYGFLQDAKPFKFTAKFLKATSTIAISCKFHSFYFNQFKKL